MQEGIYHDNFGGHAHPLVEQNRALLAKHAALVIEHAALLINHNSLVEAVKWERECVWLWEYGPAQRPTADDEIIMSMVAARAEVDRLIGGE